MAKAVYSGSLTIPASTTWRAPAKLELEVPAGVVVSWYIHGAPEHQHQVSLAVYYQGHRVFPDSEVEYFYPSETPAVFEVTTEISRGARVLSIRGANTDDTYEHTVYIAATVEHETAPKSLLERLVSAFVPSEVLED
jgi:hypothetical protein